MREYVVYLLIPTSNHNSDDCLLVSRVLYIFWFLHQTTTLARDACIRIRLYIFWFLHQTTTYTHDMSFDNSCISFDSYIKPQLYEEFKGLQGLYIFWFLHQTTTSACSLPLGRLLYIFWFLHQTTTRFCLSNACNSCISFDSYIKPQRVGGLGCYLRVVYLLIPTSNHNPRTIQMKAACVVYLLIPTSNHNVLIE